MRRCHSLVSHFKVKNIEIIPPHEQRKKFEHNSRIYGICSFNGKREYGIMDYCRYRRKRKKLQLQQEVNPAAAIDEPGWIYFSRLKFLDDTADIGLSVPS